MNSELILFGEQKEISGVVFTFSDKPVEPKCILVDSENKFLDNL